ncbi:hypothetical protein BDV10DRAFT_187946 [Aspergillus recurvatus]
MATVLPTGYPLTTTSPFIKIDLANRYCLRGVLIWAVDQDNDLYGALQGVLGQSVTSVVEPSNSLGAFSLDQCYITGCDGSCEEGDVTMTWATADENGQTCQRKRKDFPTRRYYFKSLGGEYTRKYCCPRDPEFKNCAWHGEDGTCVKNGCPNGQVHMYDWHGGHSGPPEKSDGCTELGDRSSFCCDPPLSGGSPGVTGEHPNDEPFAWAVMVGEEEDLQSFDKRVGSHLELFNCPSPAEEDFETQKIRAICLHPDSDTSNCLDIQKGGIEGTVVRLPAGCGPDRYVRAVRFEESTNHTLPGHLRKRYPSGAAVYDFHYDYDFKNLRRDGGEIYFRADLSTHPGYWNTIVASPVKRSGETWRDLDRRWLSELDPSAWLAHFKKVFGETAAEAEAEKMGLKKHYEFHRCLFEASATCAGDPADNVSAEARMYGELDTTMDLGMTLIGTLRTFDFSEAYAAFAQHDLSGRVGAALRARALLHFTTISPH